MKYFFVIAEIDSDRELKTPCVLGSTGGSYVRKLYQAHYGLLPPDIWICHRCDTMNCINARHWFLGTASDDAKDREQKGRGVGTKGMPMDDTWRLAISLGKSKATLEQVKIIRSSSKSIATLAAELGLTYKIVRSIKIRETWRHV